MSKVYDIRDYVVPEGKIKELQYYLDYELILEKKHTNIIEILYGTAICANNVQIIALLNLFVRENNIKINRTNVIKEIFYANCRHKYSQARKNGYLLQFRSFDDEIEEAYIMKYWHIFSK